MNIEKESGITCSQNKISLIPYFDSIGMNLASALNDECKPLNYINDESLQVSIALFSSSVADIVMQNTSPNVIEIPTATPSGMAWKECKVSHITMCQLSDFLSECRHTFHWNLSESLDKAMFEWVSRGFDGIVIQIPVLES